MTIPTSLLLVFLSVVTPAKQWFGASQPVLVTIEPSVPVRLVMTDFVGRVVEPQQPVSFDGPTQVDLLKIFPTMMVGGYILYAVPEGQPVESFLDTPWVVSLRGDPRPGAPRGAMAIRVVPLKYAVIETDDGRMTAAFYYDAAPNTVDNFIRLAEGGFYDGLQFHRIIPDVLVQTGDPRNDLTGGPGYTIEAEFNDRPHNSGAMSMARLEDPIEKQNALPRIEYANSAASQFFICIDPERTRVLDRRFTVFGRVVDGLDSARAISRRELADTETGRPVDPAKVRSIKILPVTAENNPYPRLFEVPAGLQRSPDVLPLLP